MTTATATFAFDQSSDATYRTWTKGLSDLLQASGLVKTTDTGQIADFTTLVRPALNAYSGYEVYRFADALQATAPVFIKVEYGTGAGATSYLVRFTFGTGSNGTGTITGQTDQQSINAAGSALLYPSYACHTTGYFGLRLLNGSAGTLLPTMLGIERSRNDTGAATTEGLLRVWCNGNGALTVKHYWYDTATWTATATSAERFVSFPAVSGTSLVVGTAVLVFPFIWLSKTQARPLIKSIALVFVGQSDFAVDVNAAFSRYDGVTHTYRRTDQLAGANIAGCYLAMLWE